MMMMRLFLEIVTNPLLLITKPLALFKFCCLAGAQIFILASTTWLLLVKAVIRVQMHVCWNALICSLSVVLLPIRMLTALHREKGLEIKLHEIQAQVESLTWENKELEELLYMSFKERREIEAVLTEMEQEQEKALAKIDLLENELQDLKAENLQLSEFHGKSLWDYQGQYDKGDGKIHDGIPVGSNYGVPSWSSTYNGSGLILHDAVMHGDTWYDERKSKLMKQNLPGAGPVGAASHRFPSQDTLEGGLVEEVALQRQRYIALSRSMFSTILSLLVGMIIWEAEDPCIPLVAALFTVVGMSLGSVVQFFSTIKNKPASDAVALLSFNWFVLGTLTSPTLPRVARLLAPPVLMFGSRVLSRLGFSS